MIFQDKQRLRQFSVSGALFLCAAVFSSFMYQNILKIERPDRLFLDEIPAGASQVAVLQGEKCVALFSTEIRDETLIMFITNGNLNLKIEEREIPFEFRSVTQFNPLGQLISANMRIVTENMRLSMDTENINPIDIVFGAFVGDTKVERKASVTGPVMIRRNRGESTYRIDWAEAEVLEKNSEWTSIFAGFAERLALEVKPLREQPEVCIDGAKDSVDVTSLVKQFEKFGNRFAGFMAHENILERE